MKTSLILSLLLISIPQITLSWNTDIRSKWDRRISNPQFAGKKFVLVGQDNDHKLVYIQSIQETPDGAEYVSYYEFKKGGALYQELKPSDFKRLPLKEFSKAKILGMEQEVPPKQEKLLPQIDEVYLSNFDTQKPDSICKTYRVVARFLGETEYNNYYLLVDADGKYTVEDGLEKFHQWKPNAKSCMDFNDKCPVKKRPPSFLLEGNRQLTSGCHNMEAPQGQAIRDKKEFSGFL